MSPHVGEALRAVLISSGLAQEEADILVGSGEVWDTEALKAEFEVLSFSAPYCRARRKSTGETGWLSFTHRPRWYFDWQPEVAR